MRSNINPKFISVMVSGRVNNPGTKSVSVLSTLNDALDIAGGVKVLKGKVTYISRDSGGLLDRRRFRYSRRNKAGSFKNPVLKSGDIIYVGNSPLNVANEILGEFTSPMLGIYSTYKILD